jgi:hypothetical protein
LTAARVIATGLLALLLGCAAEEPLRDAPLAGLIRQAESGDVAAMKRLAVAYQAGVGAQRNAAEAVRWTRMAAERGEADACNNLGVWHLNGVGVERNFAEALKWFRRSADHGNPGGQYWLGVMYENGYGVARDLGEAKTWYRRAADQALPQAVEALDALPPQ